MFAVLVAEGIVLMVFSFGCGLFALMGLTTPDDGGRILWPYFWHSLWHLNFVDPLVPVILALGVLAVLASAGATFLFVKAHRIEKARK